MAAQNSAQDSLHTARAYFGKGNSRRIKNTSDYHHQNHLRYQPAIQDLTMVSSVHVSAAVESVEASQEGEQQRSIVVASSRKEQPIVRRRRLVACPTTIYQVGATDVEGSDGWNVWSASCAMGTTYTVASGDTVKIKKSASMAGELIIDRGSDTSGNNRHFYVSGTLEMEDVTLTGGFVSNVSSFCSLHSL
jgi:hypothetical protein